MLSCHKKIDAFWLYSRNIRDSQLQCILEHIVCRVQYHIEYVPFLSFMAITITGRDVAGLKVDVLLPSFRCFVFYKLHLRIFRARSHQTSLNRVECQSPVLYFHFHFRCLLSQLNATKSSSRWCAWRRRRRRCLSFWLSCSVVHVKQSRVQR